MKRSVFLHLLSSLLLAILLITGCELYLGGDESLTDTRWALKAIENASGDVIFRPDPDQTYWIRFHRDSTISAMNACNNCGGRYEIKGSEINIGMGCTESGCGTPSPYLGYPSAFSHTMRYEIERSELRIYSLASDSMQQTLVHVAE